MGIKLVINKFHKGLVGIESQMDLFWTRVPDGSFYFFTLNWTNYHDLCINQILNKTLIMYRSLGYNRLQKRRAVLTELGIVIYCFWPESQMDLFKNTLKPNDLMNWLISQQMLLGIIILSPMDMCCAIKQFSATKFSNRKIKFYVLSDGFIY